MYCIKLGIKYSELTFGANTSRDNVGGNLCYEVNDQNLPDLNLARIDVNTVRVGEIIYQPLRENEQVLNPNRNELDLISQRGQGGLFLSPQFFNLLLDLDLNPIPLISLNCCHKY